MVGDRRSPRKRVKKFKDENAQFIDFIRSTVNEWFIDEKITENEKYFLIASLIESVSKVANVDGVISLAPVVPLITGLS